MKTPTLYAPLLRRFAEAGRTQGPPAFLAGLTVGALGFMAAFVMRNSGPETLGQASQFALPFLAGLIVGARWPGLPAIAGVTAGLALAYSAALGLGLFAFLGEFWFVAAAIILVLAWSGFGLGVVTALLRKGR